MVGCRLVEIVRISEIGKSVVTMVGQGLKFEFGSGPSIGFGIEYINEETIRLLRYGQIVFDSLVFPSVGNGVRIRIECDEVGVMEAYDAWISGTPTAKFRDDVAVANYGFGGMLGGESGAGVGI